MASKLLSLLIVLFVSGLSDRSEHLERLSNYELIHINIDNPNQPLTTIHFTAFDEAYSVELKRNDNLIPSNVRHTNGNPQTEAGHDDYFNSQTTSCHYLGKVLNTDKPSSAAISMCDKRGIRGHVHIDNETLTIFPSAYYMDTSKHHHLLQDEHIIYKVSDENVETPQFKSIPNPHSTDITSKLINDTDNKPRRRLEEQTNGDNHIAELLIFLEPTIGIYYQEQHGDLWYSELTADMTDIINWASAVYENTDWTTENGNNSVGNIRITIVEFEYAEAWSGTYTSLQPDWLYSDCTDYFDPQCAIKGSGWLSIIRTWIPKYKDLSTFDNFVAVTYKAMSNPNTYSGTSGWAFSKTMCKGGSSVNVNRFNPRWRGNGLTQLRETVTHEIGHNFGATHDQKFEPRCNTNSGLMGYGSVANKFSICSIDAINEYFEAANMGCLAQRVPATPAPTDDPAPAQTDNPTATTTSAPTVSPTDNPTAAPTTTSELCGCEQNCYICLTLSSLGITFDGHDVNGKYRPIGQCVNGHTAYARSDGAYYLYYDFWWVISTGLLDDAGWKAMGSDRRCRQDPRNCGGRWNYLIAPYTGDMDNEFERDFTSQIDDVCDVCDSCFIDDNVECLEVSNYEQDVCLYGNNNTVFDGYTSFQFMEACGYNKPIWYYALNEINESATYYLHYDKYYKYVTDQYLSVRWIISEGHISIPGIAICEQEHLTNCTNNSWIVSKAEDDFYENVIEQGMTFYNSDCYTAQKPGNVDVDGKSVDNLLRYSIYVSLAVFAVIVGISIFCMYRSDKKRRDRIAVSNDEETVETPPTPSTYFGNNQEIEVVFEIPVQ